MLEDFYHVLMYIVVLKEQELGSQISILELSNLVAQWLECWTKQTNLMKGLSSKRREVCSLLHLQAAKTQNLPVC